jgi:competence protein ComEC
VVLGLAAMWTWRQTLGVLCLAALIGRGSAALAWRAEAGRCASRLPARAVTLTLRLAEPVLPDARTAQADPVAAGCAGPVSSRWPSGSRLAAGTLVRVEGRWLPRREPLRRPEGLLVVSRVKPLSSAPRPVERLRTWLATVIRRLYGSRSGTVEALVVGRRAGMPAELKDRYARAGLVHILSISGFHVGIIVAWIVLLARAVGLPGPRAALAAAGVAVAYVLFLGWPPPAARAAALAAIAAACHLRQRHVEPISLLCVTCVVVLLCDPWAALDVGAWLSAAALGGALQATRWSDRALGTGWGWRTLSASAGATLATAPITAVQFGMVSLAGLGLNFLAIPLAAVAVPGLVASLLAAALIPPAAAPLAAASGALLGLLDRIAWWGGRWDGAAVIVPAEPASALPWLGLLLLAGWGISDRAGRWEALRRWCLALALTAWILLPIEAARGLHDSGSGLALHFLDVGQGDAAVLRTPGGHWLLVDAGPAGDGWDAGRRTVIPFLERHRVPALAVAVLSHPHADHLGGLPPVVDRFRTAEVLEPAELIPDSLYTGFLTELDADSVAWRPARAGMRFELDSVRFTVLHPDTAWPGWQEDLNEDSVVLLVEYHGFRALLTGDAGLPVEARLAHRVGRVDILKVGHHGSRSATGEAWLRELAPRVAVISSGKGNRYGHPHPEVLERLMEHDVSVWRTDRDGTISVLVDSTGLEVRASGRRERLVPVRPAGEPERQP